MRNIDNYEVYKRAHNLTLEIYKITAIFPKEEVYALTSQMRRAAASIPMNLKEGGGGTEAEFFRYSRIAYGSCEELDYQLLLSKDLNYLSEIKYKELKTEVKEIGKMLYGIFGKKDD